MEQNKVSDVSAEEWKVFSHTSALGNTGDYMSDCGIENGTISFYCDKPDDITNEELQEICDSLNASIVNENKDIDEEYLKITGHNSPKEYVAYEKGRKDEQEVIMKWIEKWNGSSNSVMGALLKKKFDERKDNVGVWVKVSERNPVKFGMYICKVKVIDDGVVYTHVAYNQYNDDKKEWVNPTISNNSCEIIEWLDESQPQQKEESEIELEERTESNMNVISDFCDHVKSEVGLVIPESAILSFFNA